MAEKLKIAKGDIGNALHSTAKDHVAVVAYETYDEELQEYQSVLNELSVINRIFCHSSIISMTLYCK